MFKNFDRLHKLGDKLYRHHDIPSTVLKYSMQLKSLMFVGYVVKRCQKEYLDLHLDPDFINSYIKNEYREH